MKHQDQKYEEAVTRNLGNRRRRLHKFPHDCTVLQAKHTLGIRANDDRFNAQIQALLTIK